MRKAAHYLRVINARLGSPSPSSTELEALQFACEELTSHPWCFLAARRLELARTPGQDYVVLPPNTGRVENVKLDRATFSSRAPISTLKENGPFYGAAYAVGWRELDGQLVRVIELGGPADNAQTLIAYLGKTIEPPTKSEDLVAVPSYLVLALEELACAIAEGRVDPEEGSVATRCDAVWEGSTMEKAQTRDGVLGAEAQVQHGQSFTDAAAASTGLRRRNHFNN